MNQSLTYPPSVDLAQLPTPLKPLKRLSEKLGREILCKRDDLTGAALSGNKIRKLEFLLAEAIAQEAQGVITCGGEQSNHARATAVAAAQLGLACHLVLRTADPQQPPLPQANILLDKMVGASIHWIAPEHYAQRDQIMLQEAARLEAETGKRFFVIPEGGSDELGAWGYIRCVEELADQLGSRPATIIYAVGSGGTGAGLIAGIQLLDLPYRAVGICVCDDRLTFQHRIHQILERFAARYRLPLAVTPEKIEIWQDYVGRGYALSRDEELSAMIELAKLEGIVTDPVYSGKALYGLISEIKNGKELQAPIVFLHTGGIYGLFAKAEQLAEIL